MNKLKFYCKNCPYKRKDEKEEYCARLNCCLIDCENQILTLLVSHCNKIREKLHKTYEEIENNEEPKFRNYSLQDYFSELDQNFMEITDTLSEELIKEIRT